MKGVEKMYKTAWFSTYTDYKEWLENTQKSVSIEIASVVEFDGDLVVTYKNIG